MSIRVQLENLYPVCNADSENIRSLVSQIVPTYRPKGRGAGEKQMK